MWLFPDCLLSQTRVPLTALSRGPAQVSTWPCQRHTCRGVRPGELMLQGHAASDRVPDSAVRPLRALLLLTARRLLPS